MPMSPHGTRDRARGVPVDQPTPDTGGRVVDLTARRASRLVSALPSGCGWTPRRPGVVDEVVCADAARKLLTDRRFLVENRAWARSQPKWAVVWRAARWVGNGEVVAEAARVCAAFAVEDRGGVDAPLWLARWGVALADLGDHAGAGLRVREAMLAADQAGVPRRWARLATRAAAAHAALAADHGDEAVDVLRSMLRWVVGPGERAVLLTLRARAHRLAGRAAQALSVSAEAAAVVEGAGVHALVEAAVLVRRAEIAEGVDPAAAESAAADAVAILRRFGPSAALDSACALYERVSGLEEFSPRGARGPGGAVVGVWGM